ncbi:2Fe-2S iron-sulfur cluster binding domain-containing protein [Mesorhizobium sp. M7A.F.Ca.US.006.01.1.1]|uniref:xanthine dehydrogenase family Fe-S subunit n=1 Tax=Mesorhizobium sp. M7A.F.Ca.US.006.01.1.1 TaxID=2496707 RepID=UPI000FCA4B5A|nr:2Fe-2S iron-sulfur cluster-binding protein [Mesorhizobium sp. M7A.F.Ca.US.006.01.1.1]RUZ73359.1 2Fe-2S iron-sulfur cluster binding domain-containing protein [Mesorhizobium sp. M7A.F.Ca.US.006.01.1.1]
MTEIRLEINSRQVSAEVASRTHLADFLREEQHLTGTHVGCEHGVCGACTVLIDGEPARSCITFAVACDGAKVTTIEGLRDDPVMSELREAFSVNHGLQCGFCTPGMLISCRDILTRLPGIDEARIRLELSGNLCRCTGYGGIVAAITSVQARREAAGEKAREPRSALGPVGAHKASSVSAKTPEKAQPAVSRAAGAAELTTVEQWRAVQVEGIELKQSFEVAFPREHVWKIFGDLDLVARCMPGARLTRQPVDNRAEGEVSVSLGPIVSNFAGVVEIDRDNARHTGLVRGAGRDAKGGSSGRAVITYEMTERGERATRVDISVRFLLSGPLAQFGRSGLVRDVADHLTRLFAANLEKALSGEGISESAASTLSAGGLAKSLAFSWFRRVFGRSGSR